jgi:uncharacterized repeat protein (TIGR01451 family)
MAAPDNASRQSLVVPPPQSNLPVALGAVACAVVGFGLVWALGIGRSAAPTPDATVANDIGPAPSATEPDRIDPASDAAAAVDPADRWRPRGAGVPIDTDGRYATRPASLDVADDARPIAPAEDTARPLSKFSQRSVTVTETVAETPAADLPDAAVEPLKTSAPPPLETAPSQPTPPVEATRPTQDEAASTESPPAPKSTSADDATSTPAANAGSGTAVTDPVAEAAPEQTSTQKTDIEAGGEPLAATQEPAAAAAPATKSEPALPEDSGDLPSTPAAAAAAAAPSAAPVSPPETNRGPGADAAPLPAGPPAVAAFGAAPAAVPPAEFRPPVHAPPPAVTRSQPPFSQPSVRSSGATLPFAAAPPIQPTNVSAGTGIRDAAGDTATGLGRPGPMQLEGVQTPQLTVEKRGPREVQVGKPARYEILVRNAGSAIAHDVSLRDSVPYGTTLVTTTPPASPVANAAGGPEGELVWALGVLPPGGQARVVMEVMPQVEGEIGSVASVSFRADASVRSRATKPDLRIEALDPKPVLIGNDIQLTIKVTNPGTGVATGVVLEGLLPDNVSHRSGRELEFDVGQLQPAESRTIDLVLGTRGPGVRSAQFSARADGGVEVEQPVKLEVTAPTLELAVDMPVRRFLQRPATCTISMVNAGTAPARSLELAAQLPPGMRFVRANNAGWHDERTHRVLWNLEELPPGETGAVEVVVMPIDLGPQKIVAAARSADGLSDQVAHICEVEGVAALSFDVVDSEDPIEVGGVTEYVVRVGNQGTKPATGVRLTATLLGDVEPLEATGPAGHRVENLSIAFEPLAKLAPAEEAVFRIRVRGRRAGDQRVQVQLVSADHPTPITKEEITRVYADR